MHKKLKMETTSWNVSIINDILYRQVTSEQQVKQQIVSSPVLITTVLEAMHNDIGHPGKDRTLSLLKDHFYTPKDTSET